MALQWVLKKVAIVMKKDQGRRGLLATLLCVVCVILSFHASSAAHSLALLLSAWISVFALCTLLSALYSMTIDSK
ncbi:unnamed protein product, partial [Mesorhabditis spiculigera]